VGRGCGHAQSVLSADFLVFLLELFIAEFPELAFYIYIFVIVSIAAVSWIARQLRNWQVLGSNIGLQSGRSYAPFCSGVLHFHQTKAGP
jgi:hypothetical protein